MPHVLAITGSSGLVGRRLVELVDRPGRDGYVAQPPSAVTPQPGAAVPHSRWDRILGLDIAPIRPRELPGRLPTRFESVVCDVTRPFDHIFQAHGVTDAVHLVFQIDPRHDVARMHRLNVGGCAHFLNACASAGVRAAVVVSSAVAYGARPDNPDFIGEEHPLRAGRRFPYSRHKVEVERLCARFAVEHPDIPLAVARPCVVVGPHMRNYLSRLFLRPLLFGAWGYDPPLQLIHERDVARVLLALLERRAAGPWNVAPSGTVRFSEIAARMGRRIVWVPSGLLAGAMEIAWRLRLRSITESPAGLLDYIRHPWCVRNDRLTRELGFRFDYSTAQAMEDWLAAARTTRGPTEGACAGRGAGGCS